MFSVQVRRSVMPSTMSKLSNSVRQAATSGRYQPRGGGGRRVLLRPSSAPRRPRMRLMVRSAGTGAIPCSDRAWRIASALMAPRSTEVALSQVATCLQDQVLQGGIGAAGLVRRVRAIGPIDAIQALTLGALDPVGHGGDG